MPVKIGDLTLQRPIFQGGMGIGISLSRLAGAVAAEGGAGTISAAQIGFLEKDFDVSEYATTVDYDGKTLTNSGVGVSQMSVKEGCTILITTISFGN